ncbi:Dabb family protein [Stratiformator vulcanicus]|uniref:Stress responsive A/B Barrel Domain protein n=1 Tax=Stratiformator vulcanicus TaxID=2527980 RepID=A0A517QZL0_9PLAN|nr:Dabb family protein [Stratiformator vulcanicus]QDT37085.1 Stress responsive A/B Barrel Domain protein [Stratiformator vulcanicus]
MKNRSRQITIAAALFAAFVVAIQYSDRPHAEEKESGSMIVHDVYFTLKDDSAQEQQRLVDACKKYLQDHPGVVFFAAGLRVPDFKREVNDQNFHVGLHVIFDSRKAHDDYQVAPKHLQFIEECKGNWDKVRVFDTVAEK